MKKERSYSLRNGTMWIFFLVVSPFVILSVYFSAYAFQDASEQMDNSYMAILEYMDSQIDAELHAIDAVLKQQFVSSDNAFYQMVHARTQSDYAFYRTNLCRTMLKDVQAQKALSCFFVNSSLFYPQTIAISAPSYDSVVDSNALIAEIEKLLPPDSASHTDMFDLEWSVCKVNDVCYLVRALGSESSFLGACVNADYFLQEINTQNSSEMIMLCSIEELSQLKRQNGEIRSLISSPEEQYALAILPLSRQVFSNMSATLKLILVFSVLFLLMLPVVFLFLYRAILDPLKELSYHLLTLKNEEQMPFMPVTSRCREIDLVYSNYNHMIAELKQMRIEAYEEKLNKLNLEMRCLRSQINPHFFIATLNTIHHLSIENRTGKIGELSLAMIEYIRSNFRVTEDLISVSQEMERVNSFIAIQSLRYDERINLITEIPDYLMDAEIVSMSILTFVENSIKYRNADQMKLCIWIRIELYESEQERELSVRIRDNGKGFAQEVADKLNAGISLMDEYGRHVGIENVLLRMKHLYAGACSSVFSNLPSGGAQVELRFPLR